jgi:hypothetical protein
MDRISDQSNGRSFLLMMLTGCHTGWAVQGNSLIWTTLP